MNTYNGIEFDKKWITESINEKAVEWARGLGEYLTKYEKDDKHNTVSPMTTSQLRRFFGEVKRIENDFEKNKEDVHMLRPMLAYAAGRDKRTKVKDFESAMSIAIEAIGQNEKNFSRFVKLFESVVAYHKFYGGKEN